MKALRCISVILLLCLLPSLAVSAEVKETDGGIFYSVSDGAVTVEGFNAAGTVMKVPAEIDGLPVRYVADRACYRNAVITKVILPETLLSVGEFAFAECKNLTEVTLEGCGTLGFAAFRNSARLRSAALPENLGVIEDEAFAGCARLGKTRIPASVTRIGVDAFAGCEQIYLDVSDNAYAKGYASDNRLPTSFTDTFAFTALMAALATAVLGAAVWVVWKKRRGSRP